MFKVGDVVVELGRPDFDDYDSWGDQWLRVTRVIYDEDRPYMIETENLSGEKRAGRYVWRFEHV